MINAFAVYARISKQLILAIPAYWMLNRPSDVISLMSPIVGTSGSLDSEFVRLLFLQTHRETDLFFTASGVQLAQSDPGQFHSDERFESVMGECVTSNDTSHVIIP